MKKVLYLIFLLSIGFANTSKARTVIDITSGNVEPIPIAITNFMGVGEEEILGKQIAEVIVNDLQNCGLFRAINPHAFLEQLNVNSTPNYNLWRKINANAVTAGLVMNEGDKVKVIFKMWDPFAEIATEVEASYKISRNSWRRVAHKIADKIYKKMTGEDGHFDTRILFVAESGTRMKKIKRLAIMDQDGENVKILTDGKDLVITPRFDQKSQRIIYMSYKQTVPKVFIYDLNSGNQKLVGNFPGMSFAPRFSPLGDAAIMSVAKDGSTNLYEVSLQSGLMQQLTFDKGVINTSPSYSPDGSKITFNSDRGGSRQLYVMNKDGSDIKRISHGGGFYTTPVWSPRGDFIAFTKAKDGLFYIGVIRPDGTGERLLTSSWLDEGPTWSPNGRVIMFSRESKDGRNTLNAVDITGYHERQVPTPGDASDPAWSPVLG